MTASTDPPAPDARVRLSRASQIAAEARGFVEDELVSRGIATQTLQKAKLIASELVTNSYKYGHGMIELRLGFPGDCIRLEVIDEGNDSVPHIREQPADETGGWGLQIVDRLARQWGVFEGTTHVWVDVPLEA